MRAALAVFRDELAARRPFLLLALGVGFVPFAAALVYHPGTAQVVDVRAATATVLAPTIAFLLAIGFGSTLFAPDLASGRLRYWLTRPVSVLSLWLGRSLAALLCIYATFLLALLPTSLVDDLSWESLWAYLSRSETSRVSGLLPALPLLTFALVFFLCQAVGLFARSSSRWLVLDLAALAAVGTVLAEVWSRLYWGGTGAITALLGLLFFLAHIAALAISGLVSLERGRADLARTHRVFSLTLWSSLALATGALAVHGWIALHPEPARLRLDATRVVAAAEAPWFALSGSLSGRPNLHGLFVCDETSRACRHLGFDLDSYGLEVLSAIAAPRGHALTWLGPIGNSRTRFLAALPDNPGRITLPPPAGPLVVGASAFSPDGAKLALLSSGRVTLLRTRDGGVLRELALPELGPFGDPGWTSQFLDDTSLLLARPSWETGASRVLVPSIRVQRIDLERGAIGDVGRLAPPPLPEYINGSYAVSLSPHGRFLAVRPWRRDWRATDPEAAALYRIELAPAAGLHPVLAPSLARSTALPTWLPDESAVWTSRAQNELTLHWLASKTGEVGDIALPGVRRFVPVAVSGEILVASVSTEAGPPLPPNPFASSDFSATRDAPSAWRAVSIQLANGEIRSLGDGLRSIPPASPGAPLGTRALFVDSRGRVVELDPATGGRQVWFTAQLDRVDRE